MRRSSPIFADEGGFSLIELMVVILIIGILAAIALPNFLSQRDRAQDSRSKADARNTVTHVEACYTASEDYSKCTTLTQLGTGLGIPIGTGPGTVAIDAVKTGYTVTATSQSGATFSIEKEAGTWTTQRTCTTPGSQPAGGCLAGGSW